MQSEKPLPRLGTKDPEAREYFAELGLVVRNFAGIEEDLLETIDGILQHLKRIVTLPPEWEAVNQRKGKRTLDRIIEEFKALGMESSLVQKLGQLNADRKKIIHTTTRLTNRSDFDYEAILEARKHLHRVYYHSREVFKEVQKGQIEIFDNFIAVADRSIKTPEKREALLPLREAAQLLRQQNESIEPRRPVLGP